MFTPTWGNDPVWLIFFKWVETTNQYCIFYVYIFAIVQRHFGRPGDGNIYIFHAGFMSSICIYIYYLVFYLHA